MTNAQAQQIAAVAIDAIASYRTNKIIMDFVSNEAREKVAAEIREEIGGSVTAKGVDLLEARYPNIKARVEQYVNLGLIGCFMASQEAA